MKRNTCKKRRKNSIKKCDKQNEPKTCVSILLFHVWLPNLLDFYISLFTSGFAVVVERRMDMHVLGSFCLSHFLIDFFLRFLHVFLFIFMFVFFIIIMTGCVCIFRYYHRLSKYYCRFSAIYFECICYSHTKRFAPRQHIECCSAFPGNSCQKSCAK